MDIQSKHVRYIYADVVRFTEDRTIEAQVEIISVLNNAFKESIGDLEVIYLPTGDGICAGILEPSAASDCHLMVALGILERIQVWNQSTDQYTRRFEIRIGINESVDTIVTDINGARNLAGAGINLTQRLMSIGDGGHIIASRSVYETLRVRDAYQNAFKEIKTETKHSQIVIAYFVALSHPSLKKELPRAVQQSDPIEIELTEKLALSENQSTAGMRACLRQAGEAWEEDIASSMSEFEYLLKDEPAILDKIQLTQKRWKAFAKAETDLIWTIRGQLQGTMWGPIASGSVSEIQKTRAQTLRKYRHGWIDELVAQGPRIEHEESQRSANIEVTFETPSKVFASSPEEFITSIAPNRIIEISENTFDLSSVKDRFLDFVRWEPNFDGKTITIRKVSNLTIKGIDHLKTRLVVVPQYVFVLAFEHCTSIQLENITFGHSPEGFCTGGVIAASDCQNIFINSCHLFGCGTEGVSLRAVTNFQMKNSEIFECTYGIGTVESSKGILFTDSTFRDNREYYGFSIKDSKSVLFNQCRFERNVAKGELFDISSSSEIRLVKSLISSNTYTEIGSIEMEDSLISNTAG